jgi:hypothetical protein
MGGYWEQVPTMAKWSRITEEWPGEETGVGQPKVTYAAGAYGRTLCQGQTCTVKQARKFLDREREQGLIRLLRERK